MAENSQIEWTRHTFNPWIGCTIVGPGCDNCYAKAWDARGLQQKETRWGPHAKRTRTSAANWRKPIAWDKAAKAAGERHRVFCASLADVFDNHDSITDEMRRDLGKLIEATPNLDWLLLTKRIGNAERFLPIMFPHGVPKNVWLGATVVNQLEADRDIWKLLAIKARFMISIAFLSMEPLLGPVDITPHLYEKRWGMDFSAEAGGGSAHGVIPAIDWVIVGGESGPKARPMHPDWARSLRDQCIAAGVAFFHKQNGEWQVASHENGHFDSSMSRNNAFWVDCTDGSLHKPSCLGLTNPIGMVRVGKARAGRLLDGVTWDQMPGVTA